MTPQLPHPPLRGAATGASFGLASDACADAAPDTAPDAAPDAVIEGAALGDVPVALVRGATTGGQLPNFSPPERFDHPGEPHSFAARHESPEGQRLPLAEASHTRSARSPPGSKQRSAATQGTFPFQAQSRSSLHWKGTHFGPASSFQPGGQSNGLVQRSGPD